LGATRSVIAGLEGLETRRLLAAFSVNPSIDPSETNFHTIAGAIAAAGVTPEEDDTIDVVGGSFTENLVIDSSLTLRGAKTGQDPLPGRGSGETLLTGQIAISAPGVIVDGFTVLNGAAGASAPVVSAIYINASDVAVTNNILTGTGTDVGILTGTGLTGIATVMQNVVGGFAFGAQLVGSGSVSVLNSRFEGNSVGVRVDGANSLITLGQNAIQNNTVAGVEIDLATLTGSASVTLTSNTLANPTAQIRLLGGEVGDTVSLSGNLVTLEGSATYVSIAPNAPITGLSTTTFTIIRSTSEDTPLNINLELDGTAVTTDATGLAGTLGSAGNLVTYTPSLNFNGNTSFTFTTAGGASGTVNITVEAGNDTPTVTGDEAFTVSEGASYALTTDDVSASDVDSSTLTFNVSAITGGQLELLGNPGVAITGFTQAQLEAGQVVYVHNGGEASTASITYAVTDGSAATPERTIAIAVNAVNDAPTLAPVGTFNSTEGQSSTLTGATLDAGDADNTDAQLVYTVTVLPVHGVLKRDGITLAANGAFTQADVDAGLVTYLHDGSETTMDSFTFTLGDGAATLPAQTLTINVATVNDAPLAVGATLSTNEDAALSGTFSGSDVDSSSLTYSIVDQPANGTVIITDAATGAFTFTPNANYNGQTSFTFQISDGSALSNVATVIVNVSAENDAPVAVGGSLSTNEDTALTGTLAGSDVDSSSLTYSIVDQPANGTVIITDAAAGAFTFTPNANYNGQTSFTFQISDGSAMSNLATVTLTVISVNDAPIAGPIPPVQLDEGQSTTIALANFFSDVDTGNTTPDVLTYSLSGAPSFVSINAATGLVTIAPGALHSGTYSFTAIATDGSNATASTPISLTVNNVVNNPPVITNLPGSVTVAENTTPPVFDVDATDSDAGQSLIYSIVGGNASGLFAIDANTGIITLTGPLDAETASQYTLTIRVTDNGPPANEFAEGTLVVNVTDENDSPTLVTVNGPATLGEGALATYTASATDADVGAALSYKWFVDDVEQVGEVGSTFSITYNDEGSHIVRVEVSDRGATPVSASKTTIVTDVAPTVPLSTSVSSVNEGASFDLIIGPISDVGAGDVASIGQVAVWWQDGTYTLINETENAGLLATLRAGGTVSVSHVFTDGQNAARPITVSVYEGEISNVYNTSIVVNNLAPTGNFAAITPSVSAGASAFVNWFGQTDVSPEDRTAGLRYTYILDVNVPGGDGIYNSGDILVAGDGTYLGSSTATQIQIPGNLLMTPGTYSVLGMLIDKDGSPILTKQISISVVPSTFQVVSLGGDHSGFTVNFNREIDLTVLNLYDGTDASVDATDVVLTRSTGQSIRGSLVLNATRTGFDFLVTGGILSQGTYTVRLNSSSSAFRDLFGGILDGNFDGVAGGNYVANFGVNAPPGPVLSTPDFSRGPGQPIDILPGNTNSDLPISMNSPIAVSSINFQLRYDQSLMNISSVVAASGLPAGWTVDYSVVTGGVNISLMKSSPTAIDIPAGSRDIVRVIASVPNSATIYGKSHVLSFATIVVNGNASIEGTADRSVHKVVFVGDANRDGTLNVGDAGLIQTIVLGQVNGFDQYPLIDPVIIVDSSRNGTVDSQDASNAGLSGFTGARPADVPAFTPVSVPVTVGIDPTYQLPTNFVVTPGSSISVPLSVIDDGRGIQSGQIRFEYDTNSLDLINITAGALLGSGWQILTNINDAEGWVEVAFYHGTALAGSSAVTGTLLNFEFNVLSTVTDGVLPLSVASPLNNPLSPTTFYDRQGGILATTALSGSLLIDSVAPSVAQTTFNFGGAAQSFTVVFSEDVGASLAAGDFELLNLTTNTAVEVVVSNVSSDGKTVTLTFANTGGVTGSILKDGDYRLRIRAGEVADLAGHVNASDVDSAFFFMNADLNHDRAVNFDDLLVLAQHYGTTSGASFSSGDVNYDGRVNFDDLLVLAQRYGTSLAMLPAKSVKAATKKTRFSDSVIG
jgi:VCBS repeat-containing protein